MTALADVQSFVRAVRSPVYIVDDDDGVRASTAALLLAKGYETHPYASGEELLSLADLHAGGCVILDLNLPGMDGLEVLRRLKHLGSNIAVVMLTGYAAVPQAVEAVKAGAIDFLEKPYDLDVLLAAIHKALAASQAQPASGAARQRIDALTPRERDVLLALVRGGSNREIAADLDLSPRTVEMHRASMMARLGVNSLSQALKIAYDAGIAADRRARQTQQRPSGRRAQDQRNQVGVLPRRQMPDDAV